MAANRRGLFGGARRCHHQLKKPRAACS
jgi:hypothetical protein